MVAPATAADAKLMILGAIQDESPVIFIEHRGLYFRQDADETVPDGLTLDQARVVREGSDVTLVSYSRMLTEALAAAGELAGRGVSVEVIDLRSLAPIDLPTILESVRKTNRLVVAHEAVVQGGIGAEIAAQVQREALEYLDAPIERIGAPHTPPPASLELERAFVPDRAKIVGVVSQMFGAR